MATSLEIGSAVIAEPQETTVRDYFALLKPRVMSLVIFSGLAGLLLAPGHIHPVLGFVAILAIALGSGASGAINMWYDRDIDAIMKRTRNRPIPGGRMSPEDALDFGVTIAVFSIFLMAVAVNLVAAGLLLSAILFYVFVYTMWLKRSTPQNIVIGGAAGAFPPMIGWAAVTGNISLESFILFAIIFMWTPPHFWALSLYKSEDYQRAGVPMHPVVHGHQSTKKQMLIYTLLLFPVTLMPVILHQAGMIYMIAATILGTYFIYHAVIVYNDPLHKKAPAMFKYSILYLFLIFTFLVIDKVWYAA